MAKKILILSLLLFSSGILYAHSPEEYYFFSREDVENIRNSATSAWGKPVLHSLEETVTERLKHSMEVPTLEGGHAHQYYCPVHTMRFRFDWDKPTAHYCEQCGKYWNNDPKFNWAWVNLLHKKNMDFLNACAYLYVATQKKEYARYIADLMLDYAIKYPTYMLHDTRRNQVEHQSGKMYAQSLEEGVFASYAARAYLLARPVMSKEEIKQIEEGYLKPCAELLLRQKIRQNFWSKPNWEAWHNSGAIAIGVALANDSIIHAALNHSEKGHFQLMQQYVFRDGWWCEGSPLYHFYTLRAMLLSAEALRCRGINLYDGEFYKMFASPAACVYSDLQFPSHNDGFYGESLPDEINLYEIAAVRFEDDFLKDVLTRVYRDNPRNSPEALQSNREYSERKITSGRKSINFPHTGIGILCSGDKTVVLKYGPHVNSHGHPDKLSIAIHDGRKEIVSDPGTPGYGVSDFRRWYRRTLPHSTLSVDAQDQVPSTGNLIRFETRVNGGIVEASADNAYEGVRMNRLLNLKGNKLTDVLTAMSNEEHTYDWMLLLTVKPEFNLSSVPAELNDSEVYECIRKVEKIRAGKSISFVADGHKITIKSLLSDGFDVYLGEAPGIPYSKVLQEKDPGHRQSVAYPVIIRIKDKDVKIEATWDLN